MQTVTPDKKQYHDGGQSFNQSAFLALAACHWAFQKQQ
jgi:hypothetical protein